MYFFCVEFGKFGGGPTFFFCFQSLLVCISASKLVGRDPKIDHRDIFSELHDFPMDLFQYLNTEKVTLYVDLTDPEFVISGLYIKLNSSAIIYEGNTLF